MSRCLSTLENNRWTANELLDHPFLKMSIHKGPNIRIESPQLPKVCQYRNTFFHELNIMLNIVI